MKELVMNSIKVEDKWIGIKFKWRGRDLKGIDCVGMVWRFLKDQGIKLPKPEGYNKHWRKETPQRLIKEALKLGKKIEKVSDLHPYDLVLFHWFGTITHIGVYIGYGKFLHCFPQKRSGIDRVIGLPWEHLFYCGVRVTNLCGNSDRKLHELNEEELGIGVALPAMGAFITTLAGGVAAGLEAGIAFGLALLSTALSVVGSLLAPKPEEFSVGEEKSPRYSFGALTNTATSELPVPICYGIVKVAGNSIYQSEPAEEIKRCDTLAEGECNAISDIRINDIPIGDLEGCSYTWYGGTSTQNVDSRFSDFVPGLRFVSHLALTLKTSEKLKGGNPTVTGVLQGTKVKTWDGSVWSGSTYSNNPAACIRDFLTNIRYGVGLPEAIIDDTSFGEVYDYCDIMVDDNEGSTEKRWTLDFIIDAKSPALDILTNMLSVFGGALIWSGSKLRLKVEKEETPIQDFDMDNIKERSFLYQYINKDDLVNKIKTLYIDPDQNYTKVFAIAEDKILQDERASIEGGDGIVEREVSILAISDFSRASRMANLSLRKAKTTNMAIQFTVATEALHCEPFDVIEVSHDVPGWTKKKCRIYRVHELENDEMEITAAEYNPSIYDDAYGSGVVQYSYGTVANPYDPVDEVDSISLSDGSYRDTDGKHIAYIDITWHHPADREQLDYYLIEIKKGLDDYVWAGTVSGFQNTFRANNLEVGVTYRFKIKTVNRKGIFSDGAISGTQTTSGYDIPPSAVQNFRIKRHRDSIVFNWDELTEGDIRGYEIRRGSSFVGGVLVATNIKGGTYTNRNLIAGTLTFYIKAIDNAGQYAATASLAQVTIADYPFQNIVATHDWHTAWDGTLNQVVKSGDYLEIEHPYLSGDYTTDIWDVNQVFFGRILTDFVMIITHTIRLNDSPTFRLNAYPDLRLSGWDISGQLDVDIDWSEDNIVWNGWEKYSSDDYKGRYFQFRLIMQRDNISEDLELREFSGEIDVADVLENLGNQSIPSGGTTVSFVKSYYEPPIVAPVVINTDSQVRIPRVSLRTTDDCFVDLIDESGVGISGDVDLFIRGY